MLDSRRMPRSKLGQVAVTLLGSFLLSLLVCWLLATPSRSNIYQPPSDYPPGTPERGKSSIIIPTYHEADSLKATISALRHEEIPDYEVIVVDDNSQDGTDKVVNKYAVIDGMDVRLITRTNASGLSSAVLDGMAAARGEYLVVMDADGQHPAAAVQAVLRLLKASPPAKAVLGSRRRVAADWPWYRRVMSWGATLLARPLIGAATSDPMTGLFAIRADVFRRAGPLNASGFKVALELLIKSVFVPENWAGSRVEQRVTEVFYDFKARTRGTSKLGVKVIFQYVLQLFSLYYYKMGIALPLAMALAITAALFLGLALLGFFKCCCTSRKWRYERLRRRSSTAIFDSAEEGVMDPNKEHSA